MLSEHYRTMGRFNAWANRTIYEAVATLSEADYLKQRPAAYFGSIHGTLNHLLVVDLLWFGRVEGVAPGVTSLDQTLHKDFEALRGARQAEDARIVALMDGLDEARLAEDLHFTATTGTAHVLPLRIALAAVFNHQTHHRGQVHALLNEAGAEPPALDIPVYWAAEGSGAG
jgi:uncharacterized damage-inducible protein DinB